MLCKKGYSLIRGYRDATRARSEARDGLLLSPSAESHEEALFLAKLTYDQAFVAWVSHRAFCSSCRIAYGKDDRLQFASV
jgi:hypothetical protein